MFSSVLRKKVFSNLQSSTMNIGYFVSTLDDAVAESSIKLGNRIFYPPLQLDPGDATLYSVPGKGGCQYEKGEVIRKNNKQTNGEDCGRDPPSCPPSGKDCQEHKTVCPQRQRPPQPCRCLGVNTYKFRKFGECPGPCPRPKKGDHTNPSDKCKGV